MRGNRNIGNYGHTITKDDAKELQAKSAKSRKQKNLMRKELQKLLLWFLGQPIKNKKTLQELESLYPCIDMKFTNEVYILSRVLKKALNGDIEAVKLLYSLPENVNGKTTFVSLKGEDDK